MGAPSGNHTILGQNLTPKHHMVQVLSGTAAVYCCCNFSVQNITANIDPMQVICIASISKPKPWKEWDTSSHTHTVFESTTQQIASSFYLLCTAQCQDTLPARVFRPASDTPSMFTVGKCEWPACSAYVACPMQSRCSSSAVQWVSGGPVASCWWLYRTVRYSYS